MEFAFCHSAGRKMLASEFAAMSPTTIERWRQHLTCVDCHEPAIYRRASSDGRAACFVGHPHAPGCPSATIGDGSRGTGGTTDEEGRYNPDDHVIIDLRLDLKGDADAPGGRPSSGRGSRGSHFGTEGATRRSRSYRRLRKLLRTLIHSPAFAKSDKQIELRGVITAPAKRFFRQLKDSIAGESTLQGYWGRITSAMAPDDTIWLNTEGPVIPIDLSDKAILLEIARVAKLAHLTNAHVLVLGRRAVSKNKRPYIAPDDLTRIAIIPVKETME